jgi:hypothetical protein
MPTNLISTLIEGLDGTLLVSGQLCLTPVSTLTGMPTGFSVGGGGQVLARQVCFSVTNGSIGTGVFVADTLEATPSIGYLVRILDQQGIEISTIEPYIQPTGPTWDLDDYVPSQSIAVLPIAISSGSQPPVGACTTPSLYYQGNTLFCCVAGAWVEVAGGVGTTATHDEVLTDGQGNFIFANGDVITVVGVPN